RSDSDMYTLGFSFSPWTKGKGIADGDDILNYIKETAQQYGIDEHIRYQHQVVAANWDSNTQLWTVTGTQGPDETRYSTQTRFLHLRRGDGRDDQSYSAEFAGRESFNREIIHLQRWPDVLDYKNKKGI